MEMNFKSIGYVKSDFKDPKDLIYACEKGLNTKTYSKIIINEECVEGLRNLEEFSHIFVIYFLNEVDKIELITHPGPPSMKDLKKVGVFASRSQYRPNPIALRLVKLIKVQNNEIKVQGLDAINNSPVLDIKPYVKGFDRPKNIKTVEWYKWLDEKQNL